MRDQAPIEFKRVRRAIERPKADPAAHRMKREARAVAPLLRGGLDWRVLDVELAYATQRVPHDATTRIALGRGGQVLQLAATT
jgi:hypothetical protein